jgi:hypothetical protein
MKKVLFSILAASGLAASGAFASPISLPANSPLYIQYTNAEQVCITNCVVNTSASGDVWSEGNWGILRVTSIGVGDPALVPPHADIGPPLGANFFNNQIQGQITGIFYGSSFTSTTTATGGFLDLYWRDTGDNPVSPQTEINGGVGNIAAKRLTQSTYTGFTDGVFLVRLQNEPGILTDVGDAATTVSSNVNPSTANGDANSYQSVVKGAKVNGVLGAWEGILDGDWFLNSNGLGLPLIAGPQDFFTKSSFVQANSWDNGAISGVQGLTSSDPTRGFTTPEPGSIALLGAVLLGFGVLRRRNG